MKKLNITPKWTSEDKGTEIDSVAISFDGQTVACSLSNGQIQLKSLQTGRTSFSITHSKEGFAVTNIKYNPYLPKTFMSISSNGIIKEWNSTTPKNSWTFKEEENQLYALDIHSKGELFATGGSDAKVRLYNGREKKIIQTFARAKYDIYSPSGHSDRIYCVKFHPQDPNILLSGGWDNTIQCWDLRTSTASQVFQGPHSCGDSIDVYQNTVIAGSWRTHDQLQMFDLRTGKMEKCVRWALLGDDRQCQIYTTKFLPDGKHFIAAGTQTNQGRIYSVESFSFIGSSINFIGGCYCCSISKDGKRVVFGTSQGTTQMHEIV